MRIVPEEPTTTKVLFPYATALRLFEVPEVCAVQFAPSDEVSKVPSAPTATNNEDEVDVLSVVVLSVVVLLSSLLLQEMMVRLKRKREKMMSICFTWFPISGLGEPNIYHN